MESNVNTDVYSQGPPTGKRNDADESKAIGSARSEMERNELSPTVHEKWKEKKHSVEFTARLLLLLVYLSCFVQ